MTDTECGCTMSVRPALRRNGAGTASTLPTALGRKTAAGGGDGAGEVGGGGVRERRCWDGAYSIPQVVEDAGIDLIPPLHVVENAGVECMHLLHVVEDAI
eukprot:gene12477-biopygen3918